MPGHPKKRAKHLALMQTFGKDKLLDLVSTGWTTRRIAALFTSETGQECSNYYVVKTLQTFGEEYEAAKKAQAQFHADRLSEITEDVETGKIDSAAARVSSDNRKWMAARYDPRQFGDKIQAEIQTTDLTQLHLEALRSRMRTVATVLPNLIRKQSESPEPDPESES